MEQSKGVRLAREGMFRGRIFSVQRDRVRLPHGRDVTMEVVRHRGSVILVAMPDPSHVILVRQYRYAVDRWLWELPAGSRNPGEDVETAARRECHEEIGLLPQRIERIASFYPTPGFCDEEMVFFRLAELVQPDTAAAQDEDEMIEPRVFLITEALETISRDEVGDMKTALGLRLIHEGPRSVLRSRL